MKAYSPETRKFQPLLVIECHSLEFIRFDPKVFLQLHCCVLMRLTVGKGTWKCVGSSGTPFTEVEFTDGEWTDYDEKTSGKCLRHTLWSDTRVA